MLLLILIVKYILRLITSYFLVKLLTISLCFGVVLGHLNLFGYAYGKAKIGDIVIKLEICQTEEELTLGLGGRKNLANDYAMLFLFDNTKPKEHLFWMKGMFIPIDIVWLTSGKIVYIEENVPPPTSPVFLNFKTYGHNILANQVLEFKAGFAKKHALKVGQFIDITFD